MPGIVIVKWWKFEGERALAATKKISRHFRPAEARDPQSILQPHSGPAQSGAFSRNKNNENRAVRAFSSWKSPFAAKEQVKGMCLEPGQLLRYGDAYLPAILEVKDSCPLFLAT